MASLFNWRLWPVRGSTRKSAAGLLLLALALSGIAQPAQADLGGVLVGAWTAVTGAVDSLLNGTRLPDGVSNVLDSIVSGDPCPLLPQSCPSCVVRLAGRAVQGPGPSGGHKSGTHLVTNLCTWWLCAGGDASCPGVRLFDVCLPSVGAPPVPCPTLLRPCTLATPPCLRPAQLSSLTQRACKRRPARPCSWLQMSWRKIRMRCWTQPSVPSIS